MDLEKKNTSANKEQRATVPTEVYCYRYCSLRTKEHMHNEVGTCADILPTSNLFPREFDDEKVKIIGNKCCLWFQSVPHTWTTQAMGKKNVLFHWRTREMP